MAAGVAVSGDLVGGIWGGRRLARARQVAGTPAGGADAAEPAGLAIVREQRSIDDGDPEPGGSLRLMRPPAVRDDFSPTSFRQDFQVTTSYLEPLVRPNALTLAPEPWLAADWRWSDDGRTITFELRDDVVWHDGARLTAADVRFSLLAHRDDVDSGVSAAFAGMETVDAVDDLTVRVELAEVDGGWLFNASTQPIFRAAQYEQHWSSQPVGQRSLTGFDWEAEVPLGTGPWRIANWDESGVRFTRHEGYWGDAAAFERMVVTWEDDPERRLAAWREGTVDLLWPVSEDEVAEVEQDPGRLYVADGASVMFAAFNFFNPLRFEPGIFADVRVRRALSLAIDRDRYAESVFDGFIRERAAGTVAQPWANASEVTNPLQDLDAAAALLAEAGWFDVDGDGVLDDGFGQRFSVVVLVQEESRPELRAVLRSVARDLIRVGVDLMIETVPEEAFRRRWLTTRDVDLIAFAYDLSPGFTDFDLFGSDWDVRTNPRGFNPGGYANAEVDAAIDDALGSVDIVDQQEALGRLQVAIDEDLFGLWLGFPRQLVLIAPDIRGFRPNKLWPTADTNLLWRAPDEEQATPAVATPVAP